MLKKFNTAQQDAISAKDGPVLVIAGAGSGKTSVLTERIRYLMDKKDVQAKNILAVTFTNKAANEMKERVRDFICCDNQQKILKNQYIWIGTFHAVCNRILRRHIELLEYEPGFNIYDKNDSIRLVKRCLKLLDLDSKQYRPKMICSLIENAKNKLIDENQFNEEAIGFYNKTMSKLYQTYQEELKKNQALDYGDLILKTVQLLQGYPDVLEYYQNKFKHILVDEYQDINHAQYVLIQLLSQKNNHLFVVGDPDQSIYRFRGAELSNIIHFEEDYPTCQVVKLEQNYRSSKMILKGASFVIKNNKYRKEKGLWTNREGGEKIKYYEANSANDEAEFVARQIKHLKKFHEIDWSCFVVLYRMNNQSRSFEEVFAKNDIPFKLIGSIRFYQRKEIKNLIYLLKIIGNPYDQESYRRWLEMDRMGIGEKGFQTLTNMADQENKTILDILPDYLKMPGNRMNTEKLKKINHYIDAFLDLRKKINQASISILVETLIAKTGYYHLLSSEDDKIKLEKKVENVKAFLQSIKEYEKSNSESKLNDFLAYISLISDADSMANENVVHLMTLHSAKGLEFPIVFLTGMEEGIFPHSKSLTGQSDLEEERRLCYVGMTRAMEKLYLTYCWRRNMEGKTKFNKVSRFLHEIPVRYIEKAEILPNYLFLNKNKKGEVKDIDTYLEIDDFICHPDWGEGKIINKIDAGNDQYITVQFISNKIKRLSLKYAPIKKIEKGSF